MLRKGWVQVFILISQARCQRRSRAYNAGIHRGDTLSAVVLVWQSPVLATAMLLLGALFRMGWHWQRLIHTSVYLLCCQIVHQGFQLGLFFAEFDQFAYCESLQRIHCREVKVGEELRF